VAGVDAVVHLAAIVGDPACARDAPLARDVNLDGSLALLEAARRAEVRRFVFASTCSNYGRMADPKTYVDEDSELSPVSLYAETKVAVERELLRYTGGGMLTTPLRFATVFGVSPRMRFDLTVNEFTAELITRGRLKVFGEQFWRPYVHVGDAARAVATVLDSPDDLVDRRVFNVGATTENYQKQRLVELIQPYAPGAVVEYVHKTEDPRDYRVSFRRIGESLGFEIRRTVPQGIAEVASLLRGGAVTDWTASRYRN
jgi:nucleoside-diphosphate-sugar epimerase